MEVNTFWTHGDLNKLEILCLNSFVVCGYELLLWTYGTVGHCPHGIRILNAREIIAEDQLFLNKRNSYASFSDLFRYALLARRNGLWADTDVFCLYPPEKIVNGFVVTERKPSQQALQLTNNLMASLDPVHNDFFREIYEVANKISRETVEWGELGPLLMSTQAESIRSHNLEVMQPEFANPINWWDCPSLLLKENYDFCQNFSFIHMYSQMWDIQNVKKNIDFPSTSLLGSIERETDSRIWASISKRHSLE